MMERPGGKTGQRAGAAGAFSRRVGLVVLLAYPLATKKMKKICYAGLWRAVDAEGEVLDGLVQSRNDKRVALKLMRKLLKKYGFAPDRMITDDLRSYGAAARELGIESHHEHGRWRNNRVENSHQPTRRRERKMISAVEPGESASKIQQRDNVCADVLREIYEVPARLAYRMRISARVGLCVRMREENRPTHPL
jgi:hypothetical protein